MNKDASWYFKRYTRSLIWSDEDDVWLGDCPDLKYCTVHADDKLDALTDLEDAITCVLETYESRGEPYPEPIGFKI